MPFMILFKATKDSEAGVMPSEKLLTDMGKYNEQLVNAEGRQRRLDARPERQQIFPGRALS